MCRILGYFGPPILLDYVLSKPEHSLIVQSYQPREMTSGVVSADGFGVGWHHAQRDTDAFVYKNTLPIWGDLNLENLSRYIESGCILANVRSATGGQSVDLSNCQPFRNQRILFTHNGFIKNFRKTLYRPIRERLNDTAYQAIDGTTDSEHIFALFNTQLSADPDLSLKDALQTTLSTVSDLATSHQTDASLNIIVSDKHQMVASRFSTKSPAPSLYWLRDDPTFPDAVIIASEPMFAGGNWNRFPENSILTVGENLDINIDQL